LDEGTRATLSDRKSRGGVIGGKGYGFQAAYIASRIPVWLADADFVQFLQEGACDVDVRFDRDSGKEIWCVQVKNHEVKVAEARQVLARFQEVDAGSPGTYVRFTLACPGLNKQMRQLRAAVKELRDVDSFFRADKDAILDNAQTDLKGLVQQLQLPVDVDFLVGKVRFDTDLAGLTNDDNLRDLFVGRLLRLNAWTGSTAEGATRAYEKLALIAHQAIRKAYSWDQVETIIGEAVSEDPEPLPPEHDDFATSVCSVISDLGSELDLDTAFHLTKTILDDSPLPVEEIWDSCRGKLSSKETSLETLRFKARVESYWGMSYAIEALEDLVETYGDKPEVLEEAASWRLTLAPDVADRAYDEERPGIKAGFDEADEHLRSLYRTRSRYGKKEIKQAQLRFNRAESRLRKLRTEYYLEEISKALEWVESALQLDPDDLSLRKLKIKIRRKVIQTKMESEIIIVDRVMLRDRIKKHFAETDIRDICFELDVEYDSLRGERKKARELVLYFSQRKRLCELVEVCSRLRPDITWWTYPKSRSYLCSSRRAN